MLNRPLFITLSFTLLAALSVQANLAELKTTISGNDVTLVWNTTGNALSFEIEVATDANKDGDLVFTTLAEVSATEALTYEFTDITPGKNGLRYYRVKQTNRSGEVVFTETATANFSTTKSFNMNVTTPVSLETIELDISALEEGQVTVTLTSLVSAYSVTEQIDVDAGSTQYTLTVDPDAPVGPYLLSLELNGSVQLRLLTKVSEESLIVTN